MDYDDVVKFIQGHFTDGLVVVIGSGLSAAEGVPGMAPLADHLHSRSGSLGVDDTTLWKQIKASVDAKEGLEAALLKHAPSESLEEWIVGETCGFLVPAELKIMSEVIAGSRALRLTSLLSKGLKPKTGLPIITTNYDRLVELACEMAGFHVDSTAVGHYAGEFDPQRSCMGSCRGITTSAKVTSLEHFPRAVVLKPHGSFDWYKGRDKPRRCTLNLDAERLVITPGLTKYKKGYAFPFDKHRELANEHINRAARLLIIGYGFNDDHLQTHLETRIRGGTPTLILTHTPSMKARNLASAHSSCICLSKPSAWGGIAVATKGIAFEHQGYNVWDIEILAKELL